MSRLYTGGGDDGTTGLFGGRRVPKDDLRVSAYGSVDELNSVLGLAAAACSHDELGRIIAFLQPQLFEIGANLCTPADATSDHIPPLGEEHIQRLERTIDDQCAGLDPLKHFILPGGSELAARLHVARTTCRLAERRVVTLAREEAVDPLVIRYLNRLSDLLFAMARKANQSAKVPDVPWRPPGDGQTEGI